MPGDEKKIAKKRVSNCPSIGEEINNSDFDKQVFEICSSRLPYISHRYF